VAGLEHHVAFVVLLRAQQAEHGVLGGLFGKEEIVAAVDHEHGDLHPRGEIEGVNLWEGLLVFETTSRPDRGLKTRFNGGEDRAEIRSPAQAVVGDTGGI
jgi:hypothetical protein